MLTLTVLHALTVSLQVTADNKRLVDYQQSACFAALAAAPAPAPGPAAKFGPALAPAAGLLAPLQQPELIQPAPEEPFPDQEAG